MKILVINGSPKGERSNTIKLTDAFVQGIQSKEASEVRKLTLSKMHIEPCKGCFACWNKTCGKCCIHDDMAEALEAKLWADIIIWSFPLYYFNVPGTLKNMIDRQLPLSLPFMVEGDARTGSGGHPTRFDMSKQKNVIISTCGFYTAEKNYDSVLKMFDHFCGYQNYETILCGQGELFRIPELRNRTDAYLNVVKKAGEEFSQGSIQQETREALAQLLYPKETFEEMADASWGVDKKTGEKEDETLTFTRQMALLYNKSSYDGKERVLEICYTDIDKTYQILLGKEKAQVFTDQSLKSTTRIDTPWEVWSAISKGEMDGVQALAAGKYRVSGDFELMIHWDSYFGHTAEKNEEEKTKPDKERISYEKKSPSMSTMLSVWITFWIAVAIDASIGGVITLAFCALIPLIARKRELNLYDRISMGMVSLLSAFAVLTKQESIAIATGYLGFGLLWLISCGTKEPLCAAYTKYSYGGEKALQNPIFMKTNWILAMAWGILYILISVWTWFMQKEGNNTVMLLVNNGATCIMAVFTVWFQKWYPSKGYFRRIKN